MGWAWGRSSFRAGAIDDTMCYVAMILMMAMNTDRLGHLIGLDTHDVGGYSNSTVYCLFNSLYMIMLNVAAIIN